MAKLGYNVGAVAPDTGGGALPPGRYELQVIEENLGENNNRTGEILKLTYEVLGPEQAGRRLWVNMNVVHENPVAQKIGQAELSALCHAVGKPEGVEDSEELLWIPFFAETKIEVDKNSGKERAAVKKYLFGDALNAPAEKAPPSRSNPSTSRSTDNGGGAAPRPAQRHGGAQGGGAAGGRSLPWDRGGGQGRGQASGQDRGGQSYGRHTDDDIPF